MYCLVLASDILYERGMRFRCGALMLAHLTKRMVLPASLFPSCKVHDLLCNRLSLAEIPPLQVVLDGAFGSTGGRLTHPG